MLSVASSYRIISIFIEAIIESKIYQHQSHLLLSIRRNALLPVAFGEDLDVGCLGIRSGMRLLPRDSCPRSALGITALMPAEGSP